jgi:hypothetical protein
MQQRRSPGGTNNRSASQITKQPVNEQFTYSNLFLRAKPWIAMTAAHAVNVRQAMYLDFDPISLESMHSAAPPMRLVPQRSRF